MKEKHQPLFNTAYLRSVWAKDFEDFQKSEAAPALLDRLKNWAEKDWQKETAAGSTFIDLFFKQTWSYSASGEGEKGGGYTLTPEFPVKGAGSGGGTGKADIALGFFGRREMEEIPQVLGEFKDDRSGLDKPQAGRTNKRSPVDQCMDYLREARTGRASAILPTWGLVTDMNEFRLYRYGNKAQFQRFVLWPGDGDPGISLLGEGDAAAFERFVFWRMFRPEWLLAEVAKSALEKLLDDQFVFERGLENEFYLEYQAFREEVYRALRELNPQYETEGRLRRLVRHTQRFLDRCLFILYCEDMGGELNFPPNVLRDLLMEVSQSKFYSADGQDAWDAVKRLFAAMRDGTPFGEDRINRFNGGLFETDAEMDALRLPNRVFCEKNQGQSNERIMQFPKTLLFLSAKYNFGATDEGDEKTLTLTAMGRIFEQSITELEFMEARAEGRESLTEITRRKRDGVYYTPEWVTHYIVEETVGARLAEIRAELGFDKFSNITEEKIEAYYQKGRKSEAVKAVGEYIGALRKYGDRVNGLKVVDPSCGSGAFLIQAFKYLYEQKQWIVRELERTTRQKQLFDSHEAMREILSENLYGVDINAESVEITRLALWLHTALSDRPLTVLDRNIRCGNSLIGSDFYRQLGINQDLFGEDERARVNTFDWETEFPEIFAGDDPGFDCVIGNPPYVKLQHFRRVQEDVAKYLLEARREDGKPLYESTQTGNFDMYLPFIEKGVELLNSGGKMGYIAPNVWMVNEYGAGIRRKLARTRRLEKWVDFKSFQVFAEATTYTALQFFSGRQQEEILFVFAPNGENLHSESNISQIPYNDLLESGPWHMASAAERSLFDRTAESCENLGSYANGISVGIQTSANNVYHLEKISEGKYLETNQKKQTRIVPIEDELMRPLVSGKEVKRYQIPIPKIWLLFPYLVNGNEYRLFSEKEMEEKFPKGWSYLKEHEAELRGRERGRFDDDQWFRFGRHQNIDKQKNSKVLVPRLILNLFSVTDEDGAYYQDDRDVGAIHAPKEELFFISGILNAPVANFIWRRISKPFQNDYRDASKQFLSPLPIPKVTPEQKSQVAEKAKNLQTLHTRRRDLLLMIDKRLDSDQCADDKRDESWFWSDVKTPAEFKTEAPPELKGKERTAWAKAEREKKLAARLETIDALLRPGAALDVHEEYGELKFLADGVPVVKGIFLGDEEAPFIAVQWRQKARRTNVTEKFTAKKLIGLLLKLRKTENPAIREQLGKIDADIRELDQQIAAAEADMNQLTYRLYGLTEEEIRLVEGG
ncbi:MAG: Eco57I restriction-modification methylase domain-containing protein [Desulfococcaceae bacterium]